MLDVDAILREANAQKVDCLLIGGMNFLLNHRPEITYDIDLWVAREPENLARLSIALHNLGAEWGPTDDTWRATPVDPGWLKRQSVYCLTTRCGALDVFFEVRGLEGRYAECRAAASARQTGGGASYLGLSDEHMLECQEALDESERKTSRMTQLRAAIDARKHD